MKIGFVRRGYSSTGGAEAYLQRLASGVAQSGETPVLITSDDWPHGAWPNDFVIRVTGGTPRGFAEAAQRATAGCDVVFSLERILECDIFRAGDGVHRAWLERRAAFEPRWRSRLRGWNRKHRELLALEERVFSPDHTGLVIANSRLVRDEILAHYNYPPDRIEIVPNGYDAPQQQPGLREARRRELGLEPHEFVALFAGSGWERKGLATAVKAARSLPRMTLLVAGKGNPRGLTASNARFLGPRKDLQSDFAAADVFVLPTIYDPFSNACLEALAAGLPVITTNANGFSEIIDPGVHGSIVQPGAVEELTVALAHWEKAAASAHEACRERAARYSIGENVRRTLAAIERVRRERAPR